MKYGITIGELFRIAFFRRQRPQVLKYGQRGYSYKWQDYFSLRFINPKTTWQFYKDQYKVYILEIGTFWIVIKKIT